MSPRVVCLLFSRFYLAYPHTQRNPIGIRLHKAAHDTFTLQTHAHCQMARTNFVIVFCCIKANTNTINSRCINLLDVSEQSPQDLKSEIEVYFSK